MRILHLAWWTPLALLASACAMAPPVSISAGPATDKVLTVHVGWQHESGPPTGNVGNARVFVIEENGCEIASARTNSSGIADLPPWPTSRRPRYVLVDAADNPGGPILLLGGARWRLRVRHYDLGLMTRNSNTLNRPSEAPFSYVALVSVLLRPDNSTVFVSGARVFILDEDGCELGVVKTNRNGLGRLPEIAPARHPRYVFVDADGYALTGSAWWAGTIKYPLDLCPVKR